MKSDPALTTVFKSMGVRYAVSFFNVKLANYVPAEVGEDRKRMKRDRKAVMCVLRRAYTGEPFTGIAILSPNDKIVDEKMAENLAMKRAIRSMADCRGCFETIWHDYRVEMLKLLDPMKWENITYTLKEIADARVINERAIAARKRLKRRLMNTRVVDFGKKSIAEDIKRIALYAQA